MRYAHSEIADSDIPRASFPFAQHMLESYASETNKVYSVWSGFTDQDLGYCPHPRASTVGEILKHQLLSERRFFGEFLAVPETPAGEVLPPRLTVASASARLADLVRRRLPFLAAQNEAWWLEHAPFFDVERQRAWIFWRRLLHTAHHRTQLTVYLKLLNRAVPSTYGPTADVSWEGADPTRSVEAASRR